MAGMDAAVVAEHVRRAAAGDRDSWAALVEAFGGLVWAIARNEVASATDAADVSQTTWLRLFEHIDRLADPSKAAAWLATTARREGRRVAARGRRTIPTDVDGMPEPGCSGEAAVEWLMLQRERQEGLYEAIERLPEHNRQLMRLLMRDPPLSYETIARTLQMPIGSIGPTRARCIRKLGAMMAPLADGH